MRIVVWRGIEATIFLCFFLLHIEIFFLGKPCFCGAFLFLVGRLILVRRFSFFANFAITKKKNNRKGNVKHTKTIRFCQTNQRSKKKWEKIIEKRFRIKKNYIFATVL
jgi:hypothetical protein